MTKDSIEYNVEWENKQPSPIINEQNKNRDISGVLETNPETGENVFGNSNIQTSGNKESKEMWTKSLEFEEDTFKIDSNEWIEVTEENAKDYPKIKQFIDAWIKVKTNATWDVVEYIEWSEKWEQIFLTYDVFIREVMKVKNCSKEEVENKYLMTIEEFKEKMKDKPRNSEEYKKFFNEEIKGHLAGYWDPFIKKFVDVEEYSTIWLAGGKKVSFNQDKWYTTSADHTLIYGYSGRLLKN